jgi:hypothetical protein
MSKRKLTIKITEDLFDEIEEYMKYTNKLNTEDAVAELIKYALSLPPYFREFNWEKAEAEADKEIASGQTKSFDSIEDFIADLKK